MDKHDGELIGITAGLEVTERVRKIEAGEVRLSVHKHRGLDKDKVEQNEPSHQEGMLKIEVRPLSHQGDTW